MDREPMGFAFRRETGLLCSRGSDSGRTTSPYAALAGERAAAPQNGNRGPIPANNPPTRGPMMNPTPQIEPIIPYAPARFSPGVVSATYAKLTVKLALVMPLTTRPMKSHVRLGARAMII